MRSSNYFFVIITFNVTINTNIKLPYPAIFNGFEKMLIIFCEGVPIYK